MKNITCHICNHTNEPLNEQSSFCMICGADLSDPQIESKLMEDTDSATYATSDSLKDIRKEAFIYLTNRRLVLIPAKLQGYGLQGALTEKIYNKMTNKSGVVSIPLENVKSIRDGKFGLLVKALIVDTTNGEMVKITVSKRNTWKEAITKAAHNLNGRLMI